MNKFAFVLMPFSDEFTDIYESGIKTVALEYNVNAERLDDQLYDCNMLEQIYNQIDKSDFIIADMSQRNPNVFYEVGYADSKKKLIILLTQNANDIPFDLKQRPHVIYEGSIKKLKDQLGSRISWALKELENRTKKPITASIKVKSGEIIRNEHTDIAELYYSLELHNISEVKIIGLELIYLYTGPNWTFFRDSKELKKTNSDIKPFDDRHLLKPDISILPPNDSISFDFIGKKMVYADWKDKDRKDEYILQGRTTVVIHTEKLTQSIDIHIESTVKTPELWTEIPF
ncbi:hypothetical protein [Treponema denticola]|uniref:hypothetical protein n=1 Tax=Treponema denticola TaxID=158 RepID=UPI002104D5B1|nr:hypothetical protein [Treponema denticola]UTY27097.1 hypothetical protein E4N77_10880 [Treponema denticola]